MKIMVNNNKNIFISGISFLVVFLILLFSFAGHSYAQNKDTVEYGSELVLDSDLDGLTDQGETQIFKTDPKNIDSDKDGYEDGLEILSGYAPTDESNFPGNVVAVSDQTNSQQEIPWAWYFARAGGLVAFLLLYISIFLGLTIRIPLLRKIFSPIYSVSLHCLISLYATLFALFHGLVLIFDKMFGFSVFDVLVPFSSKFETNLMALGIFGFYLMIILVLTSYGRKFMSQKIWRMTHFTNIILYVIVIIHAVKLGTDMKNTIVFDVFLFANALLVFVILYNIELRIMDALFCRKKVVTPE